MIIYSYRHYDIYTNDDQEVSGIMIKPTMISWIRHYGIHTNVIKDIRALRLYSGWNFF